MNSTHRISLLAALLSLTLWAPCLAARDLISITSNTGQESVSGDANVPVTSAGLLTTTLGDEDAFTNVRINITGFSVGTIVIGDFLAGISDTAEPTGMTMTSTTGTIGLNAWELVDPGSSPTWTVVDKAA